LWKKLLKKNEREKKRTGFEAEKNNKTTARQRERERGFGYDQS
jgi:hypothetical protein